MSSHFSAIYVNTTIIVYSFYCLTTGHISLDGRDLATSLSVFLIMISFESSFTYFQVIMNISHKNTIHV